MRTVANIGSPNTKPTLSPARMMVVLGLFRALVALRPQTRSVDVLEVSEYWLMIYLATRLTNVQYAFALDRNAQKKRGAKMSLMFLHEHHAVIVFV
jgi:hypothetical protein